MRCNSHSSRLLLLLAASAALVSGPVSAAGSKAAGGEPGARVDRAVRGEQVTRQVRFADLDLGSEAGGAVLRRRIASAAAQVCGSPGSRSLQAIQSVQTCRSAALSGALRAAESLRPAHAPTRLASDSLR